MPSTMPPAEVAIDVELVRSLLWQQFPQLAARSLTVLAHGWDNVLMRLGDDLVVRMPRREAAAGLISHEHRWLPQLAPLLPLPIPVPLHVGRPGPAFPWSWTISAYLPGSVPSPTEPLDTEQAARALGHFLGRLHRPAPPDAPANPWRGVPLSHRAQAFSAALQLAGDAIDSRRAEAIWRRVLSVDPWQRPPVWLHGDLHPANLLVDDAHIVAVIDFGDITAGDPATDLAIAWMLLPRRDRAVFWSTYATHADHAVDCALELRGLGWALALGTTFLANSKDNPTMAGIGKRTVAAVLEQHDRNRPRADLRPRRLGRLQRASDQDEKG